MMTQQQEFRNLRSLPILWQTILKEYHTLAETQPHFLDYLRGLVSLDNFLNDNIGSNPNSPDKKPLFIMDVFLGRDLGKQKIFVFDNDLPSEIAT
jgi:hypothetical protein